ncbi:DUF3274 domain-containing protein [Paraburkholderia silviterrae]|uniref:DUF3274 domain-containing protein n=1 Tax=Paraburkholderia silviterrae TaxID=2528715 RepID=A0A4R5MDP4_9BURK|nr:DUF3274 domain-containing protein [Paraburkholderia silviterrae]TDG25218.1 DUF3274 domain-containing protein [Paraburkholderia silviterrae]
MTDTAKGTKAIGSGAGVTMSNRSNDRNVARPRDLPGVLIFSHGVNDPGANYETVEEGLCQGLNERLDRADMIKGEYGAQYKDALDKRAKGQSNAQMNVIASDPDTYLYQRDGVSAHSVFIPFYWGYRASPAEVKKDKSGNPARLRTQYQDVRGNRLDAHFAKAGGMFNNATVSIPDMFGKGFTSTWATRALMNAHQMNNYQFSGASPDRRYQVFAAQRLAMLIAEIREVAPDETITVMAHSQGTIVSLLAQALLHDQGKRYADCLILVDSPYSLNDSLFFSKVSQAYVPRQTVQAKLQTLVNIVSEVTRSPHQLPPLKDLCVDSANHGGRAGHKWSPTKGSRLDQNGKPVSFDERDNRGRVYLYFCPSDSTVDLPIVQGIGTHGIADTVDAKNYYWDGNHTRPQSATDTSDAMKALEKLNFRQRVWAVPDPAKTTILVGAKPQVVDIPAIGKRTINGDQLTPAFVPRMHGGELKHKVGKEAPDAVTQDLALGNSYAAFQWKPLPISSGSTIESLQKQFNAGKSLDDQTSNVQMVNDGFGHITAWREETPGEARARMSGDEASLIKQGEYGPLNRTGVFTANSYHSAILRDPWNQRWGTAMDVALGQARTLDDKDWQQLWIAIADWKSSYEDIHSLAKFSSLTPDGQKMVKLASDYYWSGTLPDAAVPKEPPGLVVSQTEDQRSNPEKPVTPVFKWDFSSLPRG